MHQHPEVMPYAYRDPTNGVRSGGVFCVTAEQRDEVLRIAAANVHRFRTRMTPEPAED